MYIDSDVKKHMSPGVSLVLVHDSMTRIEGASPLLYCSLATEVVTCIMHRLLIRTPDS